MKKIFCVISAFLLCVWCAGGVAAVGEERRVVVPDVGGYAVEATAQAAQLPAAVPCATGTPSSDGTCKDERASDGNVDTGECNEQSTSEICKVPKPLKDCSKEVPPNCEMSVGAALIKPCEGEKKDNCKGQEEVVPDGTGGPRVGAGDDSERTGGDNSRCKKGQPNTDESCKSLGTKSLTEENLEHGTSAERTGLSPAAPLLSNVTERDRSEGGGGGDGSCVPTKGTPCTTPPLKPTPDGPAPHSLSLPQQKLGQVETVKGSMKSDGNPDGHKTEQAERQVTADATSDGVADLNDKLQDKKKNDNKAKVGTNSDRETSGREITGCPTDTNRSELNSDAPSSEEHNPEAISSAEDISSGGSFKRPSQDAGEQDHSKQSRTPSPTASSSTPEATNDKTSSNPVAENIKTTNNADSSVSPVWVHAPLLLLALFAVTAV
ncbi:hypothetical protein DQ04_10791010 [Trypanosoma grayi]|uniref:hypothetical protein n=1 Tax=Trypanosoma grayi TaxID=71804 RepID=UPI0004F4531B|nr:hypothetical protein DQ04_10791010 [Trypanosoma grayi]KEG07131.1 hypothetical protein DQ04_10791010 [Trypanosoma grayi]